MKRLTPFLINAKSLIEQQVQVVLRGHRPSLPRSWPAVGIILIAPGIFTFDSLAAQSALTHAAGLNLDVAYAPVAHLHVPTTLTLTTMSVFGAKGHFSLRIGKSLGQNFSIASITPQPLTTSVDGNETLYTFSGGGKDAVQITLVPKVVGRTAATLQYGLDPPVPFSVTTMP